MFQRIFCTIIEKAIVRLCAQHLTTSRPGKRSMSSSKDTLQVRIEDLVFAHERLEHEGERRILVRQHALERVHDEGEFVRHASASPVKLIQHAGGYAQGS